MTRDEEIFLLQNNYKEYSRRKREQYVAFYKALPWYEKSYLISLVKLPFEILYLLYVFLWYN